MQNYFRPELLSAKGYELGSYPDAVKLNQNELPYDLPEPLKAELCRRFSQLAFNRYPLPQPQRLRHKLASELHVEPEQIQIANGSNVLIQALIAATALQEEVLVLDPTFSVYELEARLLGNRVVKIELTSPDFSFPLPQVLKALKQQTVKIMFISNPNAPTGNLFSATELCEVLRQAPCLVVVDEAYQAFSKFTLLPRLQEFENLVVLRTFSKGFGLGGARIGYAVSSHEVSRQLAKIILPYCLPIFSEEAALFALEHIVHFQSLIDETLQERGRMLQAMQSMPQIQCFSSQTNFILFKVKDATCCFEQLLARNILIRNVSNETTLKNCLRVSVGRPQENDAFLHALRQALDAPNIVF